MRRRRGSLCVFLCVIVTALALTLTSWVAVARMRAAESELSRAMAAQIQTTLAAYDRDLLRQFGLFAFRDDAPDKTVFYASLPRALQASPLTISPLRPLTDVAVLDSQIIRHMKARLPLTALDQLIARIGQLSGGLGSADDLVGFGATELPSVESTDNVWTHTAGSLAGAAKTGLAGLLMQGLQELAEPLVREAANWLFSALLAELQEEWLGEIQAQYRQFALAKVGVYADDAQPGLLGQMPDFLNPASLASFGTAIDQLLDFSTAPIYEKICLVEYILAYFAPRTTDWVINGSREKLLTPDGRLLAELGAERTGEVEQIITGLPDSQAACLLVRFALISLRGVIHLASIMTDEGRMGTYRTIGAAVAAAIAAISAGTVVIEPEAATYLVVAAAAIAEGFSDSTNLIAGQPVAFWPGSGGADFVLWYQDYLRLFLLILPRSTLVTRCSRQIGRVLPNSYYTALSVKSTWRQSAYGLEGSYE
jgi:hypothetical protein